MKSRRDGRTMNPAIRAWLARSIVALFIAAAVLMPRSEAGRAALSDSYARIVGPTNMGREWNVVRGGEHLLPSRVRAALSLLRANHVRSFRHSAGVVRGDDPSFIQQRLSEGAFPIRIDGAARHTIVTPDEVEPNCAPVAEKDGLVLAYCR